MPRRRTRTVEDSLCSIRQLLAKSEFVIGDYQRAYQWKPKDRANLLNDILDKRTPIGDAHFIGLIITHEGSAPGDGVVIHRIIDGQQRITTLLLFMCAIWWETDKLNFNRSSQIKSQDQLMDRIENLIVSEIGTSRLTSLDPSQDRNLNEVIFDTPSRLNPYKSPLNNCRKLIRGRL